MLIKSFHAARYSLAVLFLSLLVIASCKKKDGRSDLAGLTSFSIKDLNVPFTIDESQLKIYNTDSLPFGSDVSALVAIFSPVLNATVKVGTTIQESGVTVNDFSQPVNYAVVSENGATTKTYSVVVNVAKVDPQAVAWQQVNADAGWGTYHFIGAAAYDNKFWMQGATLGSFNSLTMGMYTSTDGVSWNRLQSVDGNADSIPHGEQGALVSFNNKLWLLGGHLPGVGFNFDDVTNKVWSSTDGATWAVSTPADPADRWSKRQRIGAAVFNNKLWVIGGNAYPSFGNTNVTGIAYNDIWSSADGTTWTQATAAAPFNARSNPAVFVYNNKIWIAGGKDNGGNYLNDIWNSSDGITWTEVTPTTPFTGRFGHKIVAHNDQLLMVGGEDATGVLNDLWVSEDDGLVWTKIEAGDSRALPANFPTRTLFSMFIQGNSIWVIGGLGAKDGNGKYTFRNDIWKGSLN